MGIVTLGTEDVGWPLSRMHEFTGAFIENVRPARVESASEIDAVPITDLSVVTTHLQTPLQYLSIISLPICGSEEMPRNSRNSGISRSGLSANGVTAVSRPRRR